jgi:hypothetical protein
VDQATEREPAFGLDVLTVATNSQPPEGRIDSPISFSA